MKTAISLPDQLFEAADELAQELGVSRSQLYAQALSEFVIQRRQSDVIERLDAIYGQADARLDPVLQEAQVQSLTGSRDDW